VSAHPYRVALDLAESYHTDTTQKDRVKAFAKCEKYLVDNGFSDIALLQDDLRQLNYALAGYVQHLYDSDAPSGLAVDTLLSIQDNYWELRGNLTLPWRRITAWQRNEPPELRSAVPILVFRALLSLALLWGWRSFADSLIIMFVGVSRPGEALSATCGGVHFTRKLEGWDTSVPDAAIVRVAEPKTRWRGARQQFLYIEQPSALRWLKRRASGMPLNAKVWPMSAGTWGRRLATLLAHLHLGHLPYTPACFRAGGATYEYLRHKDVALLRLKGRWSSEKSLDRYVQEATALLSMQHFPPLALQKLLPLSRIAGSLLNKLPLELPPPRPLIVPLSPWTRARLRQALQPRKAR
jgi:hypothetical protein